jgi:hypothetical protein
MLEYSNSNIYNRLKTETNEKVTKISKHTHAGNSNEFYSVTQRQKNMIMMFYECIDMNRKIFRTKKAWKTFRKTPFTLHSRNVRLQYDNNTMTDQIRVFGHATPSVHFQTTRRHLSDIIHSTAIEMIMMIIFVITYRY